MRTASISSVERIAQMLSRNLKGEPEVAFFVPAKLGDVVFILTWKGIAGRAALRIPWARFDLDEGETEGRLSRWMHSIVPDTAWEYDETLKPLDEL